jgi:hypothetical protein
MGLSDWNGHLSGAAFCAMHHYGSDRSFTARFRESAAWEFFAEHWRRSKNSLA